MQYVSNRLIDRNGTIYRRIFSDTKGFLSCFSSTSGIEDAGAALPDSGRVNDTSDMWLQHEEKIYLDSGVTAIWGANTDVGKTLVSSGLVLSALSQSHHVKYIKPVQTGYPEDSDSRFVSCVVQSMCKDSRLYENFSSDTLFAWKEAVSPHLAATSNDSVEDAALVQKIRESMNDKHSFKVLETAGGPGSPGPSGTLQCDLLRPLRLPALLVGDGKLGGISTTLSSYEMLKIRGYSIPLIAILENRGRMLENYKIIQDNVDDETLVVPFTACMLPEDNGTPDAQLKEWLRNNKKSFDSMFSHASSFNTNRINSIVSAGKEALEVIWWPFTQHESVESKDVSVIDSRSGEDMVVFSPKERALRHLYDGCASWWTQGMDAKHVPGMSIHVGEAIGRYGHVIFPRNIHKPALELAKRMIQGVGSPWASRVFFSDNGSTAIEVGLKMAFRKFMTDHGILDDHNIDIDILGLHGAYHGDTLGTMDAVPPSVFNGRLQTPWFKGRGIFLEPPIVQISQGGWTVETNTDKRSLCTDDIFEEDQARRTKYTEEIRISVDKHTKESMRAVGACIIEPVVQGAGGMRMIDPEYHRAMAQVCRERRIPIIVDEVFTGIWRLGVESATSTYLGIKPDIGCYAKLLTGGVVPMALTLASEEVFHAFRGDSKAKALLHGHSYTAHAVGCSAGLYSLRTMGNPESNPNLCSPTKQYCDCSRQPHETCGNLIPLWDDTIISRISHLPRVKGIFSLGTVVSVQLKSSASGYESNIALTVTEDLLQRGIYARPLGDVVYIMVTPFTSKSKCQSLLHHLERALM